MQPLPRIPGYELEKSLGGGPLTTVYAARECATDEPCAVKVLRPDWENEPTAIKLLQREARAGLRVSHPHVVRFREVHVTTRPYFVVMELLPGESLRRRLRRDYRLPLATALWVARQMAEGLGALHRTGFVHGDVKPDNIRMVDDGTAVLIDLGFAHRPGENDSLLRDGYVLGTLNYLAPELCATEPTGDMSSDLFSLGVTLYEMLTAQLPYPAGTLEQTFRRHSCDPPTDIRRHVPELPMALVNLIDRLLAHKPADRPRAPTVVQQLVGLEIGALKHRKTG